MNDDEMAALTRAPYYAGNDIAGAAVLNRARLLHWVIKMLRDYPGPVAFDRIHEEAMIAWAAYEKYGMDKEAQR